LLSLLSHSPTLFVSFALSLEKCGSTKRTKQNKNQKCGYNNSNSALSPKKQQILKLNYLLRQQKYISLFPKKRIDAKDVAAA